MEDSGGVVAGVGTQYLGSVFGEAQSDKFDYRTGKITLVDLLMCELNSAPRIIKFSRDGKFAYAISELKNYITVYKYDGSGKNPS